MGKKSWRPPAFTWLVVVILKNRLMAFNFEGARSSHSPAALVVQKDTHMPLEVRGAPIRKDVDEED